jgi:hypothetical protein
MPLLVPGLVEPQSKKEDKDKKEGEDKKKEPQKDEPADQSAGQSQSSTGEKKVDGRSAPGMEGMSDEAVKRFEEAMELEYQKREGGA